MLEWIVLFSFWWWVLLAIPTLLLVWALDSETFAGAAVVTVLGAVALAMLGDAAWLKWSWENPKTLGLGAVCYLLAGVFYSFTKWYLYLLDCRKEYVQARDEWLTDKGLPIGPIPADQWHLWKDYLKRTYRLRWAADIDKANNAQDLSPKAMRNKERIVVWTAWWPLSFVWSVISDWVKRFFDAMFDYLKAAYNKLSAWVFSDI